MIKVTEIEVFNLKSAIRGMRNPLNSWHLSDSHLIKDGGFVIGEKDHGLAIKLINAGHDHSKFLRQIFVSMDIIAPIYFWKEMDTYRVGTVSNSTSTMHTLHKKTLTYADFSFDRETEHRTNAIRHLNDLIGKYELTQDKDVWRELIQDLPSSFNQLRTWTGNYENIRNIYKARRFHKLSEWRELCATLKEKLPYSEFFVVAATN